MGYSAASAQRRIEAARLMKDIPQLAEKIQVGEISLSQISLLQSAVRQVQKESNKTVRAAEKEELLFSIAHKNTREAQKDVAQYFDLPVLESTVKKFQADESVRIELTLSKELFDKVQHAQALLSHAIGDSELISYLSYVTDKVIQQKTSVRNLKPLALKNRRVTSVRNESMHQAAATVEHIHSRDGEKSVFSERTRKILQKSQSGCQYVDPGSGKKCESKWFLQTDHLNPVWNGGNADLENGQVLCGAHNRMKYRKQARVKLSS